MKERFKKCIGITVWGLLFELIVFVQYKEFSYYNYASISPTYLSDECDKNDIDDAYIETSEIPVAEGNYILELSYECTAETEWQLVDSDEKIMHQGVLDPGQTKLQQDFEISNEGDGKSEAAGIDLF